MNFFNKFFSKKKKISNQPLTEGKLVTDESLKKSVSKEIFNTDLKESIIEAKSIDVVDETTNNKTDKVLVNTKKESLNKGLKISSQSFFSKISKAIIGKSKVNDEVLDDLEEILISSDVGVKTT